MPRKSFNRRLPRSSQEALLKELDSRWARLDAEISDHRTQLIYLPSIAAGVTNTISNNSLLASRDRNYIQLQVVGTGSGAGSSLAVTLYSGGVAAGDQIFTATIAGAGVKYAFTASVVNTGKDILDVATPWTLKLVAAAGGDWADVTVEIVYEDFVSFIRTP